MITGNINKLNWVIIKMSFYNTGGSFSLHTGVNTPSIYQKSVDASSVRSNGIIISSDPYNAVNSSTIISSIYNISSFDDYVSNNPSYHLVDSNYADGKISGYASASSPLSLPVKKEWVLTASNLYKTSYAAGISYTGQYQTVKYSTTNVSNDNNIYYTSDYGNSWSTAVITPPPQRISSTNLVMSLDGSVQLFGDISSLSGNLYISRNYGVTWNLLVSLSTYFIPAIICPLYSCAISGNGNVMTATSPFSSLVFQSFDSGQTWTKTALSFNISNPFNVISADGTYQVIVPSDENVEGIFVYTSARPTWVRNPSLTLPSFTYTYICISLDGTIQSVTTGVSIYTSIDKGNTWTLTFNPVGVSIQKLYCDNSGKNQVATSFVNGIYLSTNYGMTWTLQDTPSNPNAPYFNYAVLSGDGIYELLSLTNNITENNFIYKLSPS